MESINIFLHYFLFPVVGVGAPVKDSSEPLSEMSSVGRAGSDWSTEADGHVPHSIGSLGVVGRSHEFWGFVFCVYGMRTPKCPSI